MEEDDVKQGTFEFMPPPGPESEGVKDLLLEPIAATATGVVDSLRVLSSALESAADLAVLPMVEVFGILRQSLDGPITVASNITNKFGELLPSIGDVASMLGDPLLEPVRGFISLLDKAVASYQGFDAPRDQTVNQTPVSDMLPEALRPGFDPFAPRPTPAPVPQQGEFDFQEPELLGPPAPPIIPPILPPGPPETPSPAPEPNDDIANFAEVVKGQFSRFFTPFVQIEAALRLLSAVVSRVGEELQKFNEIDERLAIVNRNLTDEIVANNEALAENTAGFGLAARALTELRVAGFKETNASLIDLISITKISGQDTQAVVAVFKDLIGTGNIQEAAADELARVIRESSTVYGTSIDTIVKSVDALSKNIQLLGLAGGAAQTTQIAAELTARLGEENAGIISRILASLTDANADLNTQLYLGLENLGDQLFRGELGTENIDYILSELIAAGGVMAENIEDSANLGRRIVSATYGASDQLAQDTAVLFRKYMEGELNKVKSPFDQIASTLSMINETVLSPFQEIVASMLPSFKLMMGGLAKLVASLLNLVVRALGPVFVLVMDVIGIVAGAVGVIADVISMVVEGLYDVLSLIPGLGRFFGGEGAAKTNATFESLKTQTELLTQMTQVDNTTNQQITSAINESSRASQRDLTRVSDELLGFTNITDNLATLQAEAVQIAIRQQAAEERRALAEVSGIDTGSIFVQASLTELDQEARRIEVMNQERLASLLEDLLSESETGRAVLGRIATGVENPPRRTDPSNPFGN